MTGAPAAVGKQACQSPLTRRLPGTISGSADRSRADTCFAVAEQASEEAGPARLVLVRSERRSHLRRDARFQWASDTLLAGGLFYALSPFGVPRSLAGGDGRGSPVGWGVRRGGDRAGPLLRRGDAAVTGMRLGLAPARVSGTLASTGPGRSL